MGQFYCPLVGQFNWPLTATLAWLEKLEAFNNDDIFSIVNRVPDAIMGDVEKTFCRNIIVANKERILAQKKKFDNSNGEKETTS